MYGKNGKCILIIAHRELNKHLKIEGGKKKRISEIAAWIKKNAFLF